MRRLLWIVIGFVGISCSDSTGVEIVPAFLMSTNGDTSHVEIPATAKVGQTITVVIHPFYETCLGFLIDTPHVEITSSGSSVDLYPQMKSAAGKEACGEPVDGPMVTAHVTFTQPGIAVVRILGRRIDSTAVTITRTVVVVT